MSEAMSESKKDTIRILVAEDHLVARDDLEKIAHGNADTLLKL